MDGGKDDGMLSTAVSKSPERCSTGYLQSHVIPISLDSRIALASIHTYTQWRAIQRPTSATTQKPPHRRYSIQSSRSLPREQLPTMSVATASAPRSSTRLAPGRRRTSPDDTFHRIDPSLHSHEEADHHSPIGVGAGADSGDRLSDFARQVIEQETDNDEHEVDDGLFHPADLGDMTSSIIPGPHGPMDSSSIDAIPLGPHTDGPGPDDVINVNGRNGREEEDEHLRSHSQDEEGEDEMEPKGRGRGRKRIRTSQKPLGPGETRDPIQMKKDSHVRYIHLWL